MDDLIERAPAVLWATPERWRELAAALPDDLFSPVCTHCCVRNAACRELLRQHRQRSSGADVGRR